MSPFESLATCFAKYADFSGRASRSEYWWFVGFVLVGSMVTAGFDLTMDPSLMEEGREGAYWLVTDTFILGTLLPNIAVGMRRFHDIGLASLIIPILFIPATALGYIVSLDDVPFGTMEWAYIALGFAILGTMLISIRPSDPVANKYGPVPEEVEG
jgi:uncharacterized membrane protein YhaH (DUF805 family)